MPETTGFKMSIRNKKNSKNERIVGWGVNYEEIPQKLKFGRHD